MTTHSGFKIQERALPSLISELHRLKFDNWDGDGIDFHPFTAFLSVEESWVHNAAHPVWSIARSPETYWQYRPMRTVYDSYGDLTCYDADVAPSPNDRVSDL
ncbi:MAG TPA: hypothetical protein VN675_02505 [Burkholderiales bacterium]|nr:hypothetical protein [Burkholderiales bacterium]